MTITLEFHFLNQPKHTFNMKFITANQAVIKNVNLANNYSLLNNTFVLKHLRYNSNTYGDDVNARKVGMAGFVVNDTDASYENVSVLSVDEFQNPQIDEVDIEKENLIHRKTEEFNYTRQTKTISIPKKIEKTIEDMIFQCGSIKLFKSNLKVYLDKNLGNEKNIIKPIGKSKEAEFYLASQFHRDYASNYQALSELKQKVENESENAIFNPQRILNVTNGPATGIIALHELMAKSDHYNPLTLEAYCLGNYEMTNKAKALLANYRKRKTEKPLVAEDEETSKKHSSWTNFLNKAPFLPKSDNDVSTRRTLYDLIILEHALVSNEKAYTIDVSKNVKRYLPLLSPKGRLVIIEKGNAFGFEVIAQARENIIKPNKYLLETGGKIARPFFFKGDAKVSEEEQPDDEISHGSTEFYYNILGPCSHHGSCPLQLYNYKLHHLRGKEMKSCNNQKKVLLPKYAMELNRGKINMNPSSDEFKSTKNRRRISSGRENQDNFLIHSYSYLLVERTLDDAATVAEIESTRKNAEENKTHMYPVGSIGKSPSEYPRIMNITPYNRRVDMAVCAPSGKIEKWHIGKSKLDRAVYKDLKNANKNDCWPHDSEFFAKKVSGRAESKEDYLELKRFLIALKKEENTLLHKELTENLNEMNKALDNGVDVSIEDKLSIEIALRGLEETIDGKDNVKRNFSKGEYKRALSFIRQYKQQYNQGI